MNISALIGFIFGVIVLVVAIITSGSNYHIFWNPAGLMIVLGGVISATFICYPINDLKHLYHSFSKVLKREPLPINYYIAELIYLSQKSMSGNKLKLENEIKGIENHFLKDGLSMVVDQYEEEKLRSIMETSIKHSSRREAVQVDILKNMTKLCPAFGMVGSLIGLIVMFQNIEVDPASIGASIAVAMMSTLYGLLLSNLFFNPCAIKISQRLKEQEALMFLIMEGLILIAKKTPPQQVKDELKVFLPAPNWQDVQIRSSKKSTTGTKLQTS